MERRPEFAPHVSKRAERLATLKCLECEARVLLRGHIVAVYDGGRASRLGRVLGLGPFRIRWQAVLRSALPRRFGIET